MDSGFHSGFTAAHAGVCRKLADPPASSVTDRMKARCSSAVIVRTDGALTAGELTRRA